MGDVTAYHVIMH